MLEVVITLHPSSGGQPTEMLKVRLVNIRTSTDDVAEYDVYTVQDETPVFRGTITNYARKDGAVALATHALEMIGGDA